MREIRFAIELREDDDRQSPGRLYGVLMEYESRAADRPELFREGALTWEDQGVVLNEQHNRQAPIVRFTPRVEGLEVLADFALPDTQRGRDAATLIRNGTFQGLSVEFRSLSEGRSNGVREIQRARLLACGLVDTPAYPTSKVELRAGSTGRRRIWL